MPRNTRPSQTMSAAQATTTSPGTATDLLEPHPLSAEELALIQRGAAEAEAVTVVGSADPTLTPPGTEGATPGAGAWISGQPVTALWANTAARNAFAYLQTAGWKKLAGAGDTGSTTMTLLAAHARATGVAPVVDENPAGTIATMYVW